MLPPWKKSYEKLDSMLKSRDITLLTKVCIVKTTVFPVVVYRLLNRKEGWVPKNWCFWTAMLVKILESPLDSKEIKPVNPKENQPWIFIGRTDAEAEAPTLCPPDWKSWLTERFWCWERLGAGGEGGWQWMRWLDGIIDAMDVSLSKLQETVKGSLVCCSLWGHKESETSEWVNNNKSCMKRDERKDKH